MPQCSRCGKHVFTLNAEKGVCSVCVANEKQAKAVERLEAVGQTPIQVVVERETSRIILTTETAHNLPVTERLGIISAEVVIGMNLFKDIASAFTDTFGGRSKNMQNGLRQARESALAELRQEAHALGAEAVVGIDLDYSEISGGGKSMLFLVASGTAVKLST